MHFLPQTISLRKGATLLTSVQRLDPLCLLSCIIWPLRSRMAKKDSYRKTPIDWDTRLRLLLVLHWSSCLQYHRLQLRVFFYLPILFAVQVTNNKPKWLCAMDFKSFRQEMTKLELPCICRKSPSLDYLPDMQEANNTITITLYIS